VCGKKNYNFSGSLRKNSRLQGLRNSLMEVLVFATASPCNTITRHREPRNKYGVTCVSA